MQQEDIFKFIIDERKKQGILREDMEKKAGTSSYGTMQQVLNGKGTSVGIKNIIQLLDVLGMEFVIQDKDANWGLDMRLRRMPKLLYIAERIESRARIREEGFHPRVDLYESPEVALKFHTKPCDVYEIYPHRMIRKDFELTNHEYGTMYSYHNWISPDYIDNRVTHR